MKKNISVQTLVVGQLQTNCYLITDLESRSTLIIDPGDDSEYIGTVISRDRLTPTLIIATHGHFDHILGVFELQGMFHIPFMLHKNDEFLLSRMKESAQFFLHRSIIEPVAHCDRHLTQNKSIAVGRYEFSVIETPGHTPGSVCLYQKEQQILISGDTLFAYGAVGRTDFAYSSLSDLRLSIQQLFLLPKDLTIYPGHGDASSLASEKKHHHFSNQLPRV